MDEVNSKRGIKKLVVFSMDVCKMFPSMVAADDARVVREEYKSAWLEVEVGDNHSSLRSYSPLGNSLVGLAHQSPGEE